MGGENFVDDAGPALRLQVETEFDPGVLIRVLERFQQLNIVPRRVVADVTADGRIIVEVSVSGLRRSRLAQLVKRIEQFPCVLTCQVAPPASPDFDIADSA